MIILGLVIDSDLEVVNSPSFPILCVYAKRLLPFGSIRRGFLFNDDSVGLRVEDKGYMQLGNKIFNLEELGDW